MTENCPKCGYTAADAQKHLDHHLCSGEIPAGRNAVDASDLEARRPAYDTADEAYELGWRDGWNKASEQLAEAEAAALERVQAAFISASTQNIRPQSKEILLALAADIGSMISPASRTALSERDARMREEGRQIGFAQGQASCPRCDSALADLAPPHPAQGVEEGR